jgi:serine/threonine protein kinase
MNAVTYMH